MGGEILLYDVISWVESSGFRGALRVELSVLARFDDPAYAQRAASVIKSIRAANHCNEITARMIYSASWGSVQLMGFNLYAAAFNFTGSVADYLNSIEAQKVTFARFLQLNSIDFKPAELAGSAAMRERFAKRYNGSIKYVNPLVASLRAYGFVVVDEAAPING